MASPAITISEDGMQAFLTVSPNDAKRSLIRDNLEKLLKDAGVTHGTRIDEIDGELSAALKRVKQTEKPQDILIAEGSPVQPAARERIELASDLKLPKELKETARRIIPQAGAPRARRLQEETVEVRKPVRKKKLFGLGANREEWQTVREKRTKEVSAQVPFKIKGARLVRQDQPIGKITAAGSGTPGRTVRGERITPVAPSDPWFYTGDYIRREGRYLIAQASGFLRIGPNWADIVPYEAHDWTLSFSKDMADCKVSYRPGEDLNERPSADDVIAEAKRQGYPPVALKPAREIDRLLENATASGSELNGVSISTPVDAFIDITTAENGLKAYLHAIKGRGGGTPLELKDIGAAIQRSGIRGYDREKIRADLASFHRSPELELKDYLLAEGTPPERGPDAAVDFALRELSTAERDRIRAVIEQSPERAGEEAHLDSFPPHEIESMAPVEADQHILTIAPGLPGKPGRDVFGNDIPGKPGREPELHLFGSVTRKDNFVMAKIDGLVDRCRQENNVYVRVRPHRDVVTRVRVSEDKLSAYLTVFPHLGTGMELTREAIDEALEKKSVTYGIREEGVQRALDADRNESKQEATVLIARGRLATPDGRPAVQFFTSLPKDPKVRIRPDGSADFRNTGSLSSVSQGAPLAAVFRETAAGESIGVDGANITASEEAPKIIYGGKNVETRNDEDGAVLLFAQADGRLEIRDNTMNVITAHIIEGDIDMSTGNIEFPSAVKVGGSVRSGFTVMAGGDIEVGDTIEAALVSSEQSVTVGGGIKGAGRAVIRAKKELNARFIERARVFGVGSINLEAGAMNASIKCNDRIRCSPKKSRIAGGEIKSRLGLEVVDLGSPRGARTQVSFGQDYVVEHRIGDLEQRIAKAQERIVQLDRVMDNLTGGELAKAQRKKASLLKKVEHYSVQLFTSREKYEEHHDSDIVVYGTLYPGVILESHGRTLEIRESRQAVRLHFDRDTGHIVKGPL
ncbi:MAG: flagellar assembly protein A [Spirochaetales bacterium]